MENPMNKWMIRFGGFSHYFWVDTQLAENSFGFEIDMMLLKITPPKTPLNLPISLVFVNERLWWGFVRSQPQRTVYQNKINNQWEYKNCYTISGLS